MFENEWSKSVQFRSLAVNEIKLIKIFIFKTVKNINSSDTRTSEDLITTTAEAKRPEINASLLLKFFKDGGTTEDILKSETEIKNIAQQIYEAKDKNKIVQSGLAERRRKAEKALKFINQLKGFL